MPLAQRQVAFTGKPCEFCVGPGLLQRSLRLQQGSLCLLQVCSDLLQLLVHFRRGDNGQHIALAHMVADVYIAPVEVAIDAAVQVCAEERFHVNVDCVTNSAHTMPQNAPGSAQMMMNGSLQL